jgi:hypothetical protein
VVFSIPLTLTDSGRVKVSCSEVVILFVLRVLFISTDSRWFQVESKYRALVVILFYCYLAGCYLAFHWLTGSGRVKAPCSSVIIFVL